MKQSTKNAIEAFSWFVAMGILSIIIYDHQAPALYGFACYSIGLATAARTYKVLGRKRIKSNV